MFVSGAASLILAVFCFREFSKWVLLLSIWIGISVVFSGTALTASGLSETMEPSRGWLVLYGLVSVVAGFVMLAYPLLS
jgi:uncharacterized membrane protein HdeD (DUF308 family)